MRRVGGKGDEEDEEDDGKMNERAGEAEREV